MKTLLNVNLSNGQRVTLHQMPGPSRELVLSLWNANRSHAGEVVLSPTGVEMLSRKLVAVATGQVRKLTKQQYAEVSEQLVTVINIITDVHKTLGR